MKRVYAWQLHFQRMSCMHKEDESVGRMEKCVIITTVELGQVTDAERRFRRL